MIFQKRQRSSGKVSNFTAEIHSRNGLMLFHKDFSGERSERDTPDAFLVRRRRNITLLS
jgi:hypothetical protein